VFYSSWVVVIVVIIMNIHKDVHPHFRSWVGGVLWLQRWQ